MAVDGDLVEGDRLAAGGLDLVRLALAVLQPVEHLAALAGAGERRAALLQLVGPAVELQRGLLLRALDALEPGLLGKRAAPVRGAVPAMACSRAAAARARASASIATPRARSERLAAKASRARSSSWARTSRTRSREKTKGGLLTHP